MLNASKKQKGKRLESFVVAALREFDEYCYRRADSGSGLHNKEDVTTKLPFHIECKNHEKNNINGWWKQTLLGCPANKYPVLIFKSNFQREPYVYLRLGDVISYLGDINIQALAIPITVTFTDFISLIREKCLKK